MKPREFLEILHVAERLKDTLRHCDTSGGRRESVGEHSWRLALMAMLLREEFPEADMNKVISMCLIHDLGEAFTGDIPVFLKTSADTQREDALLDAWVAGLPEGISRTMAALYGEMNALQTPEAKIYKALDGLEALIQHNEADISTWEPHEYDLQLRYAQDRVTFSPWLTELREEVRQDSLKKIEGEKMRSSVEKMR